jgi:hypothetical protein
VDDYPSLSWRGAHLFLGDQAQPFHKRLIANVFARYKLNNLVLQCEQARWDTLGSAAPAWAMSKTDLAEDIGYARGHFLAVTPLVESIGHMNWLLAHKPPGWSEDPATRFAKRVDSAEADQFLFDLYDEVLDTFHSPTLHIGGDEVFIRGGYPSASIKEYPRVSDAYIAEVKKLSGHLRKRKVATMLWADMLLGPGEAADGHGAADLKEAERMRTLLPHDVVLCDWHYAPAAAYASTDLLRGAGFKTIIGSTWNDPANIQAFAHSLAFQSQAGLLQTTWCGYNSSAANLGHEKSQFVAFVIAAEAAWNGGAVKPADLPYDPEKVFDEAYALPLDGTLPQPAREQ